MSDELRKACELRGERQHPSGLYESEMLASPTTRADEDAKSPTHRCKSCGALWNKWADGNWSLYSNHCGECCDNAPMGAQIEALTGADEPQLTEEEIAELVGRINANPNLHPVRADEDAEWLRRLAVRAFSGETAARLHTIANRLSNKERLYVEAETYRQMHEDAKELGYPSILEALEDLERLKGSRSRQGKEGGDV